VLSLSFIFILASLQLAITVFLSLSFLCFLPFFFPEPLGLGFPPCYLVPESPVDPSGQLCKGAITSQGGPPKRHWAFSVAGRHFLLKSQEASLGTGTLGYGHTQSEKPACVFCNLPLSSTPTKPLLPLSLCAYALTTLRKLTNSTCALFLFLFLKTTVRDRRCSSELWCSAEHA
jgi:hypothetical protein